MLASSCVLPCLNWKSYLFFISETSIFIFIRSDNWFSVLLFVHCIQLGCSKSCVLILFFLSLLFSFFMWLHIFYQNNCHWIFSACIIIQIFLNFKFYKFLKSTWWMNYLLPIYLLKAAFGTVLSTYLWSNQLRIYHFVGRTVPIYLVFSAGGLRVLPTSLIHWLKYCWRNFGKNCKGLS